ncbi:hypothetical protein T07_3370 [Trichinella nelsoni]|uniref:Uncharacterized protein n=1 Tax=Trichinella nelsoni TaxID=6336 RepID=A0A0V0SB76_9BILA|nr:hypothetical protein T07_3370 [Trichinella nelsoni]
MNRHQQMNGLNWIRFDMTSSSEAEEKSSAVCHRQSVAVYLHSGMLALCQVAVIKHACQSFGRCQLSASTR